MPPVEKLDPMLWELTYSNTHCHATILHELYALEAYKSIIMFYIYTSNRLVLGSSFKCYIYWESTSFTHNMTLRYIRTYAHAHAGLTATKHGPLETKNKTSQESLRPQRFFTGWITPFRIPGCLFTERLSVLWSTEHDPIKESLHSCPILTPCDKWEALLPQQLMNTNN